MKVSEIVELVNKIKPNAYNSDVLVSFLNQIESMAWTEIFGRNPEDFIPCSMIDNADRELLIVNPYDTCYMNYISAMIDFQNEELTSYNNNMTMFNAQWLAYTKYMQRNVRKEHRTQITKIW